MANAVVITLMLLLMWIRCYPLALLVWAVSVAMLMKPNHQYQGPFDEDIEADPTYWKVPPDSTDWMMEYKECRSVPSVHVRGLGAEELSTLSTVASVNLRQRSETPEIEAPVNSLGSTGPPDGRR